VTVEPGIILCVCVDMLRVDYMKQGKERTNERREGEEEKRTLKAKRVKTCS
jgi:hypothetical protein